MNKIEKVKLNSDNPLIIKFKPMARGLGALEYNQSNKGVAIIESYGNKGLYLFATEDILNKLKNRSIYLINTKDDITLVKKEMQDYITKYGRLPEIKVSNITMPGNQFPNTGLYLKGIVTSVTEPEKFHFSEIKNDINFAENILGFNDQSRFTNDEISNIISILNRYLHNGISPKSDSTYNHHTISTISKSVGENEFLKLKNELKSLNKRIVIKRSSSDNNMTEYYVYKLSGL